MSETVTPVSAPAAVAGRKRSAGHYIGIEEAGLTGMISLKGDLGDGALAAAVQKATGAKVPGPLGVESGEGGRAVWMAPDELLLITAYADAEAQVAAIGEALAGQHHMALNVSDARCLFRLSGKAVAEVLAKGAPVDLSEAAFPVGSARRTHIAEIAVGFWRTDAEAWEIVCFRSLAGHLADWLDAVSVEGAEVGFF